MIKAKAKAETRCSTPYATNTSACPCWPIHRHLPQRQSPVPHRRPRHQRRLTAHMRSKNRLPRARSLPPDSDQGVMREARGRWQVYAAHCAHVYAASVITTVRTKMLMALLKVIRYLEADGNKRVLTVSGDHGVLGVGDKPNFLSKSGPIASFASSILSSKDQTRPRYWRSATRRTPSFQGPRKVPSGLPEERCIP